MVKIGRAGVRACGRAGEADLKGWMKIKNVPKLCAQGSLIDKLRSKIPRMVRFYMLIYAKGVSRINRECRAQFEKWSEFCSA
jgi:hypothetical protein